MNRHGFRRLSACAVCLIGMFGLVDVCHAQSFGLNFQSTIAGFGPYSVQSFGDGTAFGIDGLDWYENSSQEQITPTAFNSPSMNGGSVNIDYYSQPYYNYTAFGWAHANMEVFAPSLDQMALPDANMPHSGEEAVLAGFNFAVGPEEYVIGDPSYPIVVHITGLNSIGSSYKVRLMASSDVRADHYSPGVVADNADNSGTVNFDTGFLAEEPAWNQAWQETYSRASVEYARDGNGDVIYFTGDELTITVEGNNEFWSGWPNATNYPFFATEIPGVVDSNGNSNTYYGDYTTDGSYTRTTLAGLGIYFEEPPSVPGDFDLDGNVDGDDFLIWQANFPTASDATLGDGDADGDGDVDGADFVVWQTNFPYPAGSETSPVPEPSTVLLALIGVLAFGSQVWSRR
jgi:hypothetical protein